MIFDMINGVWSLKNQEIQHRDLSPSNILLKSRKKKILKICDLG
jgi:serine/threonine protein kinase